MSEYEKEKAWLRVYRLLAIAAIIASASLVVMAGTKVATFIYYLLK